jgi:hypothetical protein
MVVCTSIAADSRNVPFVFSSEEFAWILLMT